METPKQEERWKKLLHNRWIAGLGLLLGILLLVASSLLPQKAEPAPDSYKVQYYTDVLEERITALCNNIHGVQDTTVLLTLDSGSEYVYAQNTTENGTGGAWDYVILQQGSGEDTILVTEIYPKIRGVAVVCTGGDNVVIQRTITELLSASLGISSHRIRVAGK